MVRLKQVKQQATEAPQTNRFNRTFKDKASFGQENSFLLVFFTTKVLHQVTLMEQRHFIETATANQVLFNDARVAL